MSAAPRLRPVAAPRVVRGVALAVLANFGLLHWMGMVEPWEAGRAFAALAVALAAFAAPRRALPLVAVGALVAGGVAPADLLPTRWGALAGSIMDGTGAVVGVRTPYAGDDPDLRLVIYLGGSGLATLAGLLARRHRLAALAALIVLYAVPAVAVDATGGFLGGAAMAVLVVLFVCCERLPQRDLGRGAVAAGVAALLALAVAPALDAPRPWFDYEEFAVRTAGARTTVFGWNHDYGRLPWPRDGREMLRVRSPRRTYYKTRDLELFDGRRWVQNPARGAAAPAAETFGVSRANLARWTFVIGVGVRNLRSSTLVTAGSTESVRMPGFEPRQVGPAVWAARRPIRRGDAYAARVYVPEPSRAQLAAAGARYPVSVLDDLSYRAVDAEDGVPFELLTRAFAAGPSSVAYSARPAAGDLRRSNLRRIHGLSRRLLRDARTPYEYVRAVQRHLAAGYRYDETPPRAARNLDGFLFDARAGFCQQFSGAMALLLRMGGVPARVTTGFAPGSFDDRAERYVVRDLDAHSWVEAWFAGIGWVVFDPTPAAAPPRSQAFSAIAAAGNGDIRGRDSAPAAAREADDGGGTSWSLPALVVLAAAAVAGGWWLRLHAGGAAAPELERALRGAGVQRRPGETLLALRARLPEPAGGYLDALRAQRFAAGPPPSAADRRALRHALAAGRGPLVRARVFAALRRRR